MTPSDQDICVLAVENVIMQYMFCLFVQEGDRGRVSLGRGKENNTTCDCVKNNNSNELIPGIDGITHDTVTCYGCYFNENYREKCIYTGTSGIILMYM